MTDSLDRSFGLIIAFLLPGFVAVLGITAISPTLASWLSATGDLAPSFGGVSYIAICSSELDALIPV
jgi:hypothetical protein